MLIFHTKYQLKKKEKLHFPNFVILQQLTQKKEFHYTFHVNMKITIIIILQISSNL